MCMCVTVVTVVLKLEFNTFNLNFIQMLPTANEIQYKLLVNLNSQRLDGKFCDVRLNIHKASYPVHSCVLATFCPGIFESDEIKALAGDWSFKQPCQVNISSIACTGNSGFKYGTEFNYCSICALKVIEFMYLGSIQISKDHLSHVEVLGSYLQIEQLLVICKNVRHQCSENSLEIFSPGTNVSGTMKYWDRPTQSELLTVEDKLKSHSSSSVGVENVGLSSTDIRTGEVSPLKSATTDSNLCYQKGAVNPTLNCVEPSIDHNACSKCGLTFSNSAQLRQHRETHLGKLYSCYSCKYSSQKVIELMNHLLEANHNERVCSLCMYEGETTVMLKEHMEQHKHPKPFFCAICNLRFTTRTGLNFHTPKHSTKTPFCCSVCQRGFKWKHNLQSHLIVHTSEKKHLCDVCGFSTAHKSTFNAHELSHTGHTFKCQQTGCKFEAVSKRNLVVHLATHTKEKPYQCEICGQAFSQSKNLRRHALKHDSSVDSHQCPVCSFKTLRYDKLKEHFKKHHSTYDEKLLPVKKKKYLPNSQEMEPKEVPFLLQDISLPVTTEGFLLLPISDLPTDSSSIQFDTQT